MLKDVDALLICIFAAFEGKIYISLVCAAQAASMCCKIINLHAYI
jgi:hypothetical protein